MKKVLSLLLAVVMVIGLLPVGLIAASAAEESVTMAIAGSTGTLASDSSSISWTSGALTFTNVKSASTTPIRTTDSDHYRLYKNSDATITYAGGNITKIEITCLSADYASVIATTAGAEASTSDTIVTIVPGTAADTYTITGFTSQTRFNSITVYAEPNGEVVCQHPNLVTTTTDATCTEAGSTVETCPDCDYTKTTEIEATGHSYDGTSCTVCGTAKPAAFVKTELSAITADQKVIITMTKDGTTWAMSNNGTSSAPSAVTVTVENDEVITEDETLFWNISNDNGTMTIYPDGTTESWLYCTNTNNGVRVGTNENKAFTIDETSGYLANTATSRYLGVYNAQDWRCYTSPTTANIANQTLGFYVLSDSGTGTEPTPDPEPEPEVPSTDATLMTQLPIDGDVVIIYNSGMAMTGTASGTKLAGVEATVTDGKLPYTADMAQMTVRVDGEYYSFELNGTYLTSTGTGNNLSFATTLDNYAKWTIAAATDGTWYITNAGANYNGNYNQAIETYNGLFTTYGKKESEIYQMQLFLVKANDNDCAHNDDVTVLDAVEADCTTDGKTEGLYCNDCDTLVTPQTVIPATGHTYVEGFCSVCSEAAPTTFATLLTTAPVTGDNILIYNATNNIVMTATASGSKLTGSEGVVAESKLYYTEDQAVMTVTVSGDHYIFVCGGKYLTATGTGGNLSFADTLTEGGKWTIAAATEDAWYITNAGVNYNGNYNQAIEYYSGFTTYGKQETAIYQMQLFKASAADAACAHTNTVTQAAVEVTCTTDGVTEGKTCADCGVVTAVPTVVTAQGHQYTNGSCSVCGEAEPVAPDAPTTGNYTLVTDINEILAGGQFVIVAQSEGTNYAMSAATSGRPAAVAVEVVDGVVTYVEGTTPVWTLVAHDGGVALQAGENYLSYGGSGTSFTSAAATAPFAFVVTAVDGDNTAFVLAPNNAATARGIFYQVSGIRFGAYSTSNTSGYVTGLNLYKLTAGGTDTPVAENYAVVENGEQTTYATLQDALNNADPSSAYVKLLANAENVNVTLDDNVYIDLNGYTLTGTMITDGCAVYGMDSATDEYTCDTMGAFNCVDEDGSAVVPQAMVKASVNGNKRYLTIETENGYTFHRFYMGITHATLKPGTKGVGYKAVFAGDDMVKACIDSFGFQLQLGDNTPYTASKAGTEMVSLETVTLRVDNYDTESMGLTELSASVYMVVNGEKISSDTYTTNLKTLVETINAANTLTAEQKEAMAAWIAASETMKSWDVSNIYTETEPEA